MNKAIGKEFEKHFMQLCIDNGLNAQLTSHNCKFDLFVNGFRVQCKAVDFVDYCNRRSGRITITRGGANRERYYCKHDFDFFAIKFSSDVHVVPVEAVGFVDGKIKKRFLVSRLKYFRDRFDLLTQCKPAIDSDISENGQMSFEF